MYNKWQRAAQRTNQNDKEFRAYLQLIQSNWLDFNKVGACNKSQIIYCIQPNVRSEIRIASYCNSTVFKDWPTFLEAVVNAESSIHSEYRTTSKAAKPLYHNRKKQADKSTNNNHSHGSSHKSQKINTQSNTQGRSRGREDCASRGNYQI